MKKKTLNEIFMQVSVKSRILFIYYYFIFLIYCRIVESEILYWKETIPTKYLSYVIKTFEHSFLLIYKRAYWNEHWIFNTLNMQKSFFFFFSFCLDFIAWVETFFFVNFFFFFSVCILIVFSRIDKYKHKIQVLP